MTRAPLDYAAPALPRTPLSLVLIGFLPPGLLWLTPLGLLAATRAGFTPRYAVAAFVVLVVMTSWLASMVACVSAARLLREGHRTRALWAILWVNLPSLVLPFLIVGGVVIAILLISK